MSQQCTSNAQRQFATFDTDVPVQAWKYPVESVEPRFAPPGRGPMAPLLDRRPADRGDRPDAKMSMASALQAAGSLITRGAARSP